MPLVVPSAWDATAQGPRLSISLIFPDFIYMFKGRFSRNEHIHVVTIPTSEPPTRTIHLIGTLATVTDQYSQRILKWPCLGSSVIMWMDRDVES